VSRPFPIIHYPLSIINYQTALVLIAVAILAGCDGDGGPDPGMIGSPHAGLEVDMFRRVNAYRAGRGLPTLAFDTLIARQAREHSVDMANERVPVGHDGRQTRVRRIEQSIPLERSAEIVALVAGYSDPLESALDGWIESEGHRRAMESEADLTGVGIAVDDTHYYITQIFVLKKK
jgi:uncharacterized protein YkwD